MKKLIKEYAGRKYPIIGDYNKRRYGNDRMNEFIVKTTAAVVQLKNGALLGIEKPRIETHFCFHDEGAEYNQFLELRSKEEKMKSYFLFENTKKIKETIADLKKSDCLFWPYVMGVCENVDKTAALFYANYNSITNRGEIEEGIKAHELAPHFLPLLDPEEKAQILRAYEKVLADFEKRLATWWKRYGAEKLHTWTYWADE